MERLPKRRLGEHEAPPAAASHYIKEPMGLGRDPHLFQVPPFDRQGFEAFHFVGYRGPCLDEEQRHGRKLVHDEPLELVERGLALLFIDGAARRLARDRWPSGCSSPSRTIRCRR